jgi:hypothetical protein
MALPSVPTITTTNLELSPCIVTFNGTVLGATLGNVVITTKYMHADLKADQTGLTVLDRAVNGIEVTVTTELAEFRDKTKWEVVFPHATKLTTGGTAIEFKERTGLFYADYAHKLKLHPIHSDPADADNEHIFYKAVSTEESGFTFGPSEQARLKIVWLCLPDISVSPYRFYRFGDEAVT